MSKGRAEVKGVDGRPGGKRALSEEAPTRFRKVVVTSGHMIDSPDRPEERFPSRKEGAVRARIASQLDAWGIGAGDLAICGGASGTDMIFAELCAERGAEVWLLLALPEEEFLEASVRPAGGHWEARFLALRNHPSVKTFRQPERLELPSAGGSAYWRNNLWMIDTARGEVSDPKQLSAILVWDENPTGDGPGGTADFAAAIIRSGGRLAPIINPTKL